MNKTCALVRLALAGAVLAPATAHGLAPDRPMAAYGVRAFGLAAGLPQTRVQAIAEDRDGYLWIGTMGGLARWDGIRFETFTPASTGRRLGAYRIDELAAADDGTVWIGTHGGGAVSAWHAGAFRSLSGQADARGSAATALLPDGAGGVWIGSWDGAVHVTPSGSRAFDEATGLPHGPVFALARDRAGVVWAGTSSGLARYDGARFVADAAFTQVPIFALAADSSGGLWVGSGDRGVLVRTPNGAIATFADGLPDLGVRDLLVDRDGQLWVATRAGLARLVRAATRFDHVAQGALAGAIDSLFEDRAGQLWIGTSDDGLVRLADGVALPVPAELATEAANTLALGPDDTLWIGTDGAGLSRLRNGRVDRWTPRDGLCAGGIASLLVDGDALWIGGTGANAANLCVRERDGTFRSFGPNDGLPAQGNVRVLLRDRTGALWVGGDCLFRAAPGTQRFTKIPLPTQASGCAVVFSGIETHTGELWFGSSAGTFRRTTDGDAFELVSPTLALSLAEDRGAVLMGFFDGLGRWSEGAVVRFREPQGVPEEPVLAVLPDDRGDLWFSTSRGVFHVARDALAATATHRGLPLPIERFGADDGLPSSQAMSAHGQGAGLRTRDGRLWFTTARGPALIDPTRVRPRPVPPVVLEDVVVDGARARAGQTVSVPPGARNLEVSFTAPTTVRADELVFRHQLTGYDRGWVSSGVRRSAVYTGLPAGTYRFAVAVRDATGTWHDSRQLAVVVEPHLTERASFRAALLALAAAIALAVHRLRLRSLAARHAAVDAERTRIAREVHDTMAQGLVATSLHLELAAKRLPQSPDDARRAVDEARRSVRLSLADARRVVWELNPAPLATRELPAVLAAIAKELSIGVPIRLQVDGTPRALQRPIEAALVRGAQEALTNALRHASPSTITLTLSYGTSHVELVVRDDGKGLSDETGAGQGLDGLRARLADVGGAAEVRAAEGGGTEVRLRAPARERQALP